MKLLPILISLSVLLFLSFLTLDLPPKVKAQEAGPTVTGVETQQVAPENLETAASVASPEENFPTVSIAPIANFNFRSLYQNFPWGLINLGNVPFDIPEITNGAWSRHGVVTTLTLQIDPVLAKSVYLLINSWDTWLPYNNLKLGEISITFEDNTSQKTDLVIGDNIREWRHGNDIFPTVNTKTSQNSTEVFRGNPSSLAGPAVLDMLKIDIDQQNQNRKVTSISVTDSLVEVLREGNPATDPNLFWAGLTLEKTGPESLPVPYFSQNDPQWGLQEYDHANSLGPFYCGNTEIGKTIADCGCAMTSAAMILRYYGIEKGPTGEPTTPETLNNWLKDNNGYPKGVIDWFAVAKYSKVSNDVFNKQPKIEYIVTGTTDQTTLKNILDQELADDRPTILQVRPDGGHFVVATGISADTYLINDPLTRNNDTLQFYQDKFVGIRRYRQTNSDFSGLLIVADAPTQFMVIDEQGRKTGQDLTTGLVLNEIPNSSYYLQPPIANDSIEDSLVPPNVGTFQFELSKPEAGQYQILVSSETPREILFRAYDQTAGVSEKVLTSTGTSEYILNYSPHSGFQIQVTQIVDIDIKPRSDPNSINLSNIGVIPVAILTTPSLDATQIDVATIRFGPGEATETHNKSHLEDVDGDGDIDMALHFRTPETGIQKIDTETCLTGTTLSGVPIQGCDSVRIVGK